MKRFWIVLTAVLVALLLMACGGAQSTPTSTSNTPPVPTSTPATTGGVTKLDTKVGSPPATGWKWAVMQRTTGPDEVVEDTNNHGNPWVFYVLNGTTEIGATDGKKLLGVGQAALIPARQDHTHRFPGRSDILGLQLRPGDRPPNEAHGGKLLFTSEQSSQLPAGDYSLRLRDFTLARGGKVEVKTVGEPFAYVMEGTLSAKLGSSSSTDAGKVVSFPVSGTISFSNEGTTPLKFVLADLHQ